MEQPGSVQAPKAGIEAEEDEVAEVVSPDAGAEEETVVVALVDAAVTQGAVVAALRLVDLAGGAVTQLFAVIVRQAGR